jgi:protocatechuate 3,4-dioxygenase beta subunit
VGHLREDLEALAERAHRRDVLRLLAGASLLPFLGCSSDAAGEDGQCVRIPEETAGPYPGDGSNGPNALALSGIVRSDIRSSIAGATGTAPGLPLTLTLTLVNVGASCAPLAGAAVYVWHCDALRRYSLYSSGVTGENWLRGVQQSDAAGRVTFVTVFPGCYPGRWPHIHVEVYPTAAAATGSGSKLATTQIALPQASCAELYATNGYTGSAANFSQVSLATDSVFSDGVTYELASVTGSVAAGYALTLTIGVSS